MQAEITYNWDDIEVGRFDLNHSENFFTEKHLKHEKFSEEFKLIQAMDLKEVFPEIALQSCENKENSKFVANQEIIQTISLSLSETKEQVKLESCENKEISKFVSNQDEIETISLPLSETEEQVKPESCENKENSKFIAKQEEIQTISIPLSETREEVKLDIAEHQVPIKTSTPLITTQSTRRRPANLLTRSKTLQTQVSLTKGGANLAAGKSGGKVLTKMEPPHVYGFKDIYQKKKDEKMKKLLEEERKNRVFVSRPVPKSVVTSREQIPRKVNGDFKSTVPITPMVLKNSRQADEKRMQRMEELRSKNQPLRFTSREAVVLQEEPFKPKKPGHSVQPQPFNLHVERRIEVRKQYDEQHRRATEEKKKQEEETRKKREEELIKEIRKQATFKARPNPFK